MTAESIEAFMARLEDIQPPCETSCTGNRKGHHDRDCERWHTPCPNFKHCAENQEACPEFWSWCTQGRDNGRKLKKLHEGSYVPVKGIYDLLYTTGDRK